MLTVCIIVKHLLEIMQEIALKFRSPFNYALGGGTVVGFCGRILALGTGNLQISWCKCPGVPRGQPSGMAADKCTTTGTPVYTLVRHEEKKTSRNAQGALTSVWNI